MAVYITNRVICLLLINNLIKGTNSLPVLHILIQSYYHQVNKCHQNGEAEDHRPFHKIPERMNTEVYDICS